MAQRPRRKYWYKGKILNTCDVLRLSGVSKDAYKMRVRRGWSLVLAMTLPVDGRILGEEPDLVYEVVPIVQGEFHKKVASVIPADDARIKVYENMLRSGDDVDARWLGKKGFQQFLKDMGERPVNSTFSKRNLSVSYSPSNCYWRKT